MKRIIFVGVLFFCFFTLKTYALPLEAIEVHTGYFTGDLDDTDKDYEAVPLLVAFDFDAKPLLEKIGIKTKGRFNLIIEPFTNTIFEPFSNVEIGCNFLAQYTFPLTDKFQPYIKGGAGILYMSLHTREQSTQYNFVPQFGGGFYYFLKDNMALSFEYRYRHLSNAGIKHPNSGINVDMALTGVSFFF